ncbi:MAG: Ig-like domain-containing protein [Bacillota bacterium]|nr:Ig-like domain-containing protein [Bacillota bacterium]
MKRFITKAVTITIATMFAFTGAFMFNGPAMQTYADVGSVSTGEEITYDKNGDVLTSLGFDTSKMPEDYDADSTDNPYGEDVTTLKEVSEMLRLDTSGETAKTQLYGHDKKLDGKYSTLTENNIPNDLPFLNSHAFLNCAKCDISGDGRASCLAIVYTNYNYELAAAGGGDNNIYLRLYNPKTGDYSDAITVSSLIGHRLMVDFLVQSQLQITAGDYDSDSIDEIAVYVPAQTDNGRAKVAIYDLINGQNSADPYSASSWHLSWNYVLPTYQSEIIGYDPDSSGEPQQYFKNFYNNIDLVSGDADNDGPCDLVVSYGASSTGNQAADMEYQKITRSLPSRSVLLYGSNDGQMLKDSQELSYDGNDLIRVSFAFGHLDDDNNEDLVMGGQLKSEQGENTSRVLCKYSYDKDDDSMTPDVVQDLGIVDGNYDKGKFITANGWDEHYYSSPVMKTNLAVGKFHGDSSQIRIYMDSVLYSYDNEIEIEDEMEDSSKDPLDNTKTKGSTAFTDIKGIHSDASKQWEYYEYGAATGNFTGDLNDYLLVTRVSKPKSKNASDNNRVEAVTSVVMEVMKDDEPSVKAESSSVTYGDPLVGSPCTLTIADTDKDSLVAEYTGDHGIDYQDPKVLAVMASAPYFEDVADYDEGDMLSECSTSYGKSTGSETAHKQSFEFAGGVYTDFTIGTKMERFAFGLTGQISRSQEWGDEYTKEYEISYDTGGGENAVVLFSIPTQTFRYRVKGVLVDDDGNYEEYDQEMILTHPHQPVTQTLTMDDYMEIQEHNSNVLPDVSKYITSKPGDPYSYPKTVADIKKIGTENKVSIDNIDTYPDWAGVAYGSGSVEQSISHSHSHSKRGNCLLQGATQSIRLGWYHTDWMGTGDATVGVQLDWTRQGGSTYAETSGDDCAGKVANMPRSAKDYGYDYSWRLVEFSGKDQKGNSFPVVTYMVDDVQSPPVLPANVTQDFDQTTDEQIALTWDYNETVKEFDVYRYFDFPQGSGDQLVGTVKYEDGKTVKDKNGHTVTDQNGKVLKKFTFIEGDLSPDTKYRYRIKAKRAGVPPESIFSPVVEARTDVAEKPNISLTSDELTIYPDGTYSIKAILADPEHYESTINYQWQKFAEDSQTWEDIKGCNKNTLEFYQCKEDDAGRYRCRMNLIRKKEGGPQYISTFTDFCDVTYSLRDVVFGDISVDAGSGLSATNTQLSVSVMNASATSTEKPTGDVYFTLSGPNGDKRFRVAINEETGMALIPSIEDVLGTAGQAEFVNGGYLITAWYAGSKIFYPADDPQQYHYLRNIDESLFLSTQSSYTFGEDIMTTTNLYDYKRGDGDRIEREDRTDQITTIKFYAANENGEKVGDAVKTYTLSETDGKAPVPLNSALQKRAYIEAYTDNLSEPAGHSTVKTVKRSTTLTLNKKTTGTGTLCQLYTMDEVELTGDGDINEKNIDTSAGAKSLGDLLVFKYYEANGDYMFDSTTAQQHISDFIPATYQVRLAKAENPAVDPELFYKPFKPLDKVNFYVVGNFYLVSASCADENTGSVSMIAPEHRVDPDKVGFAGGTRITLKAVPNKGFKIKRWVINECGSSRVVDDVGDTLTYTVTSGETTGNGEINIKAVLEPKNNTLTYEAKGSGTVTVSPEIESGRTVLADTALTFTGTPADGWKFEEWRWTNTGGNNTISRGLTDENGVNTKTFRMGDTSAQVYGVFMRETIDLDMSENLIASYINNGSNPLEDNGKEILTEKGRAVPKGTQVIVKTKAGYELDDGSDWVVTVTTPEGTHQINVEKMLVDGRDACRFTLPEDVTECSVAVETKKGRFSVEASAENVTFHIKVDGNPVEGSSVDDIEAGSNIEISAAPQRGKVLTSWIVNGRKIETSEKTYTTTLTDNLSVTAETADDTKLALKLSTTGGGTGQYTITDKNGEDITRTFGETQQTIDAYKGETLKLDTAQGDKTHTMTSIVVNGETQELDEGTYTSTNISEDMEILCRFQPNTYCTVKYDISGRDSEVVVKGDDGIQITNGETISVPYGERINFTVTVDKDHKGQVLEGEKQVDYNQESPGLHTTTYGYTVRVTHDMTLTVHDFETYYIYTNLDFQSFMARLAFEQFNYGHTFSPNAVVMEDIEVPADYSYSSSFQGTYEGTFDGNGHTVKGIHIGSAGAYASGVQQYFGLFEELGEEGCIKDVAFEDMVIYTEGDAQKCNALVTNRNKGTISGVMLKNCELHITQTERTNFTMAGLAVVNEGTIQNCEVSGLLLDVPPYQQGVTAANVGCAGVISNQVETTGDAVMSGNYFEGLRVRTSGGIEAANGSIIAPFETGFSYGTFEDNYYKAFYMTTEPHGTNVCKLTKDPENEAAATAEVETADFARKLAYHLNDGKEALWGTRNNNEKSITPVKLGGSECKAPVKVVFQTDALTATLYLHPGMYSLADSSTFGEHTPAAWKCGDELYSPGFGPVEIIRDTTFVGVEEITKYVASIGTERNGTAYYNDLDSALAVYNIHNYRGDVTFKIIKDCTADNASFQIYEDTTFTIKPGVSLTLSDTVNIDNKGTIDCPEGSTLHKYGSIQNKGTILVNGTFYNYGSKLTNTGTIENQKDIICKPHCAGEWVYADEPNEDGSWTRTSTCSVCTNEITDKIPPDPPANRIESIYLMHEPDQTVYEEGEAFTDEGMTVVAKLTDGTKAAIKSYTMTAKLGDVEKAIKNGDVLDQEGVREVTVHYENFTCGFEIDVMNTADLLTLTDKDGNVITKGEMNLNEMLDITASLKHPVAVKPGFLWESSDPKIADIDSYTLDNKHKIVALSPGRATITVTAVDENENPIAGIMPKTVDITVVEHITDLQIIGGDRSMDMGQVLQIETKVVPEDTTDELTWSSSDESVAAVDPHGFVTAVAGGTAVITVAAPSGISASCQIAVKEKAETLALDNDALNVSIDGCEVLAARVEPATANGAVTWTTDNVSAAGFYVKDEKTGEMKVVDKVTTDLSADGSGKSETYVLIYGAAAGEAVIKAETEKADGTMLEQRCHVTVSDEAGSVTITHNGASVSGEMLTLNLAGRVVQFSGISSEEEDTLEWSVIDDDTDPVIRVNNTGKVTMLRTGTAVLRLESTVTGASDVCAIKVKVSATGVVLSDSKLRLAKGDTKTLIATLTPKGAEDDIIWTSSDESVATVSSDGTITGVADGTATITARPDNEGASEATCEVTVYEPYLTLELTSDSFIYDGKMHYPAVTVRCGRTILGENLTQSNDKVVLSYDGGRRLPGFYTVTAVANDKSYGYGTASYQIKVKPTTIKKVKKGKKKFKVKWQKVGKKYIKGYQIRYSKNSDMSNAKYKTVGKYKKRSKTIKRLKAKTQYYVQVRTYIKKGGVKYYSDWSETRTVKTR